MRRTLLLFLVVVSACGTMPSEPKPEPQRTAAECAALRLKLVGRLPNGDTLPDAVKPFYPSGVVVIAGCARTA